VARKYNAWNDRAELDSAADLGLVEAATAFNPARGVRFTTFSYYRIRGAIYDYLRQGFPQASLFDASSAARNENAEQECAEFRNIAGALATVHLLSLDAATQQLADKSVNSPEEQLLENERRACVRRALDRLPPKKKQVLEDYYYRGMSLEEIGRGLGLSRSHVCRLHAKSLEEVRALIAAS
jgi:RNA polymerase sigma factor for flagellar operon FliA